MPGRAIVVIGSSQWSVGIASTYAELAQGLAGLTSIPPRTGILFDLGMETEAAVTTALMLFPLDIAWLDSDGTVIHIELAVMPGNVLSVSGARYFLEVNSGEMNDIAVGNRAIVYVESTAASSFEIIAPIVAVSAIMAALAGLALPAFQDKGVSSKTSKSAGASAKGKVSGPIAKVVTVPGGSFWTCVECGRSLKPGEKAVKLGAKVICSKCVQSGRVTGHSIPPSEKATLVKKYGSWAVGLGEALCPENDVECVRTQCEALLKARGILK